MRKILWGIKEFISLCFDVLDAIQYFGGGTMIAIANTPIVDMSIPSAITFTAIGALLIISGTIRIVYKYKRWNKYSDLRKACFDIAEILQKMHNRMAFIATEKAKKVSPSKCLQVLAKFVYRNNKECMTNYNKNISYIAEGKIIANKATKADIDLFNILVATFDENKIGIRQELANDAVYQLLQNDLDKAFKYCDDEKVDLLKREYLNISLGLNTQIILMDCLTRQKKIQIPDNIGLGNIVYPEKVNEKMAIELVKIKKQIMRYWING